MGREQQLSGLPQSTMDLGQEQKPPGPPEITTQKHPTKGSGRGYASAATSGLVPGTGINPTHPSREASPQGMQRGAAEVTPLRQPDALVGDSERPYSAGRGKGRRLRLCANPIHRLVASRDHEE